MTAALNYFEIFHLSEYAMNKNMSLEKTTTASPKYCLWSVDAYTYFILGFSWFDITGDNWVSLYLTHDLRPFKMFLHTVTQAEHHTADATIETNRSSDHW